MRKEDYTGRELHGKARGGGGGGGGVITWGKDYTGRGRYEGRNYTGGNYTERELIESGGNGTILVCCYFCSQVFEKS